MSDALDGGGDVEGAKKEQQSAGVASASVMSEEATEKLKLLNYEEHLCQKKGMAPLHKAYFAIPDKNASIQFKAFLDVATWLLKLCGQEFTVDKFDDPTTSVNKLLLVAKNALGFEMDFPVTKLKVGSGDAVCSMLNFLCDKALASSAPSWERPKYPEESYPEEAEVDEEAEVADVSEEIPEEDEPEILYADFFGSKQMESEDVLQASFIEANVDPTLWKTELERVESRLKAKIKDVDIVGEEWRAHIDQTKKHDATLVDHFPNSRTALQQITDQVGQAVERISGKEKAINSQFDELIAEYQKILGRTNTSHEKQRKVSEHMSQLTNELAELSDQLEDLKSHMDDRGNSMTDTSPLVKIKTALQTLKQEIKAFDLRIGVVGHTLMQTKLRMKLTQDKIDSKKTKKKVTYEDMEPEMDVSEDELF